MRVLILSGIIWFSKYRLNPSYETVWSVDAATEAYYGILALFVISNSECSPAEVGLGAHRIRCGLQKALSGQCVQLDWHDIFTIMHKWDAGYQICNAILSTFSRARITFITLVWLGLNFSFTIETFRGRGKLIQGGCEREAPLISCNKV